jgi:hypothetical protein
VDAVFRKNRDKGPNGNAKHPIPKNLPELNIEIIPEIDTFPTKNAREIVHDCIRSIQLFLYVTTIMKTKTSIYLS